MVIGSGMGAGIDSFRQVGSGWLEREIKKDDGAGGGNGVRQSDSSRLSARIQGWFSSPTAAQSEVRTQDRIQVKEQFLSLLTKTEGKAGAERALAACGLPRDFAQNDRPLTNHIVKQLLNSAQSYRMQTAINNEKLLAQELKGLQGVEHRDLRAAISREVKNHADFGSKPFTADQISLLRRSAEADHNAVREKQCEARFPGLSRLIAQAPKDSPLASVARDPATLTDGLRGLASGAHGLLAVDPHVGSALDLLDTTTELLGRQAWNQTTLVALSNELTQCRNDLQEKSARLSATAAELLDSMTHPDNTDMQVHHELQQKFELCYTLKNDLNRQIDLLDAKSTYVEEMRRTDPLTDRSIKYGNLVAAHACQSLLDGLQYTHGLTAAQQNSLADVRTQWSEKMIALKNDYDSSSNVETLKPIEAGSKKNKETHPAVEGKRDVRQALLSMLEQAGIPKDILKTQFSKDSIASAERSALSSIDTWQPINRDMAVMRDGTMRVYKSQITPAQFIHADLGVRLVDGRTGGVVSGVRDSYEHARSLKVSRLVDPQGQVMSTVVGHGVLDMWDVRGTEARSEANQRGAKEVLEVALSSNDRLRAAALAQDPAAPAPRLVHVSVNLITPDTARDWIPTKSAHEYKERTYTFNQFKAFDANSGPMRTLRVFDPADPTGEPKTAKIDVDTITFSFGTNALATGWKQHLMDVWSNVHEHNTENMIKFVGDLGDGAFGARGARPGGFVGEVYDRLETMSNDAAADPVDRANAADLMGKLRGQTDLVRGMFTEETFRRGNGDTAKMGREVLVLQGLAEQSLDLVKATDLAGTSSKGCKSDKDRGGVTDVELKSKLILQDLGGEMNPDEKLQGDDQGVYYTVSASSGQLDSQRGNTGFAGSKEASHLKDRLPDPEVRQFLTGLGAFTKA